MRFFTRKPRRSSRSRSFHHNHRPRFERLENRLLLTAGFGSEDGAYIVEPWDGIYSAVQIQSGDQQIVAAGTMDISNPNSTARVAIARYDSLGNPDAAYGSGGLSAPALAPTREYAQDLVLQSDGNAVVSVFADGDVLFGAARFDTNGTLDGNFGSGGWNAIDVREDFWGGAPGIGLQTTGKVVIAGYSMNQTFPSNHDMSAVLAAFRTDGALDSGQGGFGQVVQGNATGFTLPTFGANHNRFQDLAIQPDDKIVTVGSVWDNVGGETPRSIVARFTATGTLDTSFNSSGYTVLLFPGISTVSYDAVALQTDGKIVAVGHSTGIDGSDDMLVARYNTNGTLDTSFGGGSGYVRLDIDGTATQSAERGTDMTIQPDGKIVVGGWTSGAGNPSKSVLVARFNQDGTADASFAGGGFKIGSPAPDTGYHSFQAQAVALHSDGSIIVAGWDAWNITDTNLRRPLLMRFSGDSTPTAVVTPTSGLITTEAGGQAAFTVTLDTQPTADVIIPVSSSDTTEGTVSSDSLTFTPADWNLPQAVAITGVDDAIVDGNIVYTIVLGAAASTDNRFNGLDPADVTVTNTDDDIPPTKFYVVNDATANLTYEYSETGTPIENYALNTGNSAPRGAAATAAGDKTWVVDANKKVYVYNNSGALFGSWTAGTLASNATVEGIATNGTDVWIVDSKSDKVFRYTGAASRLSGSQNAASSFALNIGNTSPKDIVTDGVHLWVVNDSSTDKVFKYTVAGSLVGSWTISSGGGNPTGITIDPTNVSDIWIVDSASDRVYQFTAGASRTSGSQSPAASFALAAGNTNPQGIADPPAGSAAALTTSDIVDLPDTRHARHRAAIDFLLAEPEAFDLTKPRRPRLARV